MMFWPSPAADDAEEESERAISDMWRGKSSCWAGCGMSSIFFREEGEGVEMVDQSFVEEGRVYGKMGNGEGKIQEWDGCCFGTRMIKRLACLV